MTLKRLIRRNVTRYTCLGIVLAFRYVSSKVYKRFPTIFHLIEAGLCTEDEAVIIERAASKSEFVTYIHWIPFTWASALIQDVSYKRIRDKQLEICAATKLSFTNSTLKFSGL